MRELLNKHKLFSEQFICLAKELQQFAQSLKNELEIVEKNYFSEQDRIEYIRSRKENIFRKLTDNFTKTWEIVESFDRVRYAIHKDYYQRALGYLLLDPIEINRRIYQKPFGYPGDYVIMNYICDYNGDNLYLGSSIIRGHNTYSIDKGGLIR